MSTACVWVTCATARPSSSVSVDDDHDERPPDVQGAGDRVGVPVADGPHQGGGRRHRGRRRPRGQVEERADGADRVREGHQRAAVQDAAGGAPLRCPRRRRPPPPRGRPGRARSRWRRRTAWWRATGRCPPARVYRNDEPVTTERTDVPRTGGERETLRAYLDFHRETLALKCAGLSDDDLRRRTTPSSLTLLGLVRHMAEVERAWFRRVLDGQDIPLVWSPDGNFQVAYDAADAAPEEAFAAWQAEIAHRPGHRGGRAVPRRHRRRPPVGRRVLAAPHPEPPDPGVRPAQRPRRPHPRGDRRQHRGLTCGRVHSWTT